MMEWQSAAPLAAQLTVAAAAAGGFPVCGVHMPLYFQAPTATLDPWYAIGAARAAQQLRWQPRVMPAEQ